MIQVKPPLIVINACFVARYCLFWGGEGGSQFLSQQVKRCQSSTANATCDQALQNYSIHKVSESRILLAAVSNIQRSNTKPSDPHISAREKKPNTAQALLGFKSF